MLVNVLWEDRPRLLSLDITVGVAEQCLRFRTHSLLEDLVMGQAVSLALFIGVPLLQGAIGGMLTAKDVKEWFPTLKKPRWTPPGWAIGPLWATFYTIAGVGSSLIVRKGGFAFHPVPLSLYLAHFVFNFAWTPIFFKARSLGLAFADLVAMLGFTTLATIEYFKIDPVAGYLMATYVGWQCFVTALNYTIWRDNRKSQTD